MSRRPITMPVLSDTMSTGRLVQWLKKEGEPVKKGEVIAEVESDKAIMEVEAFEDGYLAGPLTPPDTEVPVGTVIGYLSDRPETAGEQAEAPSPGPMETAPPAATEEAPTGPAAEAGAKASHPSAPPPPPEPTPPPSTAAPASASQGIQASPYARALAQELGIDLTLVTPGTDGTIRAPQIVAAALAGPQPDLESGPPYHIEPVTTMQRAVADNMSATRSTPTFRVSASLSLKALKQYAHEEKQSLSLLLARACALTVVQHPRFNALYTPQGMAQRERVDVGIAVDVPDGLVTPVIRDAATRPLDELAEDWRILKDKVKRRRLSLEDYTGATFYLSNLGVFPEVTRFDAIVPLGAAAILALGAENRGRAEFTLSCDHRVVYGADAARFLQTLGKVLEKPGSLSNT